ncbi:MAG: hypothetical protein GEV04_06975 [Actinophytocola sp.]|nr:hypothetical protein [Actinophytocola sp.]
MDDMGRLSARERGAWDGFHTAITMLTEHLERRLQQREACDVVHSGDVSDRESDGCAPDGQLG